MYTTTLAALSLAALTSLSHAQITPAAGVRVESFIGGENRVSYDFDFVVPADGRVTVRVYFTAVNLASAYYSLYVTPIDASIEPWGIIGMKQDYARLDKTYAYDLHAGDTGRFAAALATGKVKAGPGYEFGSGYYGIIITGANEVPVPATGCVLALTLTELSRRRRS